MKEIALRWDLRITNCENGYRCNWLEEVGDEIVIKEVVFEDDDSESGATDAMKNLLWFVKEHFGIYFSKNNQENLVIEIQQTN